MHLSQNGLFKEVAICFMPLQLRSLRMGKIVNALDNPNSKLEQQQFTQDFNYQFKFFSKIDPRPP